VRELFPDQGNGPYRLLRGFSQEAIGRLQRGCESPEELQQERISAILEGARGTAFARDHGLSEVRTLAQWRDRVPLRSYDDLRPWLDRAARGEPEVLTRAPVTSLLKTSGTTGASKLLPVTAPYERAVAEGQALWRLALVRDHEPVSRGKALSVVSPAVEGRVAGGLPYGSNTGRMYARQPWVVRLRYPAPAAVFNIPEPEPRLYAILRFALQAPITSITTANPSTVLRICRKLEAHREALSADLADGTLRRGPAAALPAGTRRRLEWRLRRRAPPTDWRPASLWDLEVINCWKGGPAPFFLARLPAALGAEVPVREVGITASEGYFAVPLSDGDEGGVAWLGGHVLEFIDDAGAPRWAWELEQGRRYRLVITTSAGLYRYDLDDVLEVSGFEGRAPVLRFVRKGSNMLNLTGEKVTEDQVLAAGRDTFSAAFGDAITGFTAAYRLADLPALQLAVEGLPPGADLPALAAAFDRALARHNIEYAAKRDTDRLAPPELLPLPPGTYARWRAARLAAGAPDSQLKDLVIAAKPETWQALLRSR
jgi:hypothetical protein